MRAPNHSPAPRLGERIPLPGLCRLEVAHEVDGAFGIQKSGTLRQRVIARIWLRGVLNRRFHEVWRQVRICLEHQGHGAGDHGRRHAGPREAQVRLRCRRYGAAQQKGRLCRVQETCRVAQRDHPGAGRKEIRLCLIIDRRRASRAVGRIDVVHPRDGPLTARCSHRQDPRRVTGRRDAAVLGLPQRVPAEVPGSCHDDDARVHRALGGLGQRVGVVRFGDPRADRQIDDADVVGLPVRDRPFERGNHVADDAAAGPVEHLQPDQVRIGRDAGARPGRVEPVAGEDTRHMRAVAVVVVR